MAPLYADTLARALREVHADVQQIVLPDGEAHKDWPNLNRIFDHLLAHTCDRKTVLYALGGGVIGDMTGFAAACYMRGVPYVQVPTTLLAQVDSSVGGKTAINHPAGKNMIGAFYQPRLVLADLDTLDTLPPREIAAGLAEVIKYGPIADDAFFGWIEDNLDALLRRDRGALAHAVRRSCEIKAWVVGQDEREAGLRAILNFGHTFGHAIEAGARLRRLAAWRGGRLRHGDGGRPVARAAAASMPPIAQRISDPGRTRRPAGARARPRRGALPRADAGRQEGRGRRSAVRADRGAGPGRTACASTRRWSPM